MAEFAEAEDPKDDALIAEVFSFNAIVFASLLTIK
jgi:hypothetical protein